MKPTLRPRFAFVLVLLSLVVLTACIPTPAIPATPETRTPVEWTIISVRTATDTPQPPTPTTALSTTPASSQTSTATPPQVAPSPDATLSCQEGKGEVVHDRFDSQILGYKFYFTLYLPPCYDPDAAGTYPVLYLLHGLGSDDSQWVQIGVPGMMDELIASGEVQPFIIVMPREPNAYAPVQSKFDLVLIDELRPYVDEHYATRGNGQYRAIGGLSRGAGWALRIGMNFPQFFSAIGMHSVAVFEGDDIAAVRKLSTLPVDERPALFIDIGSNDSEIYSARDFEHTLFAARIAHTWYELAGTHNEAYWQAHAPIYLRWYSSEIN